MLDSDLQVKEKNTRALITQAQIRCITNRRNDHHSEEEQHLLHSNSQLFSTLNHQKHRTPHH